MRTIEAPGVEWKEYDLSQVAPAMGGPVALCFGFADKGQKETIYNITGSASDRVIFGTPKNEAERYFYKARMKVLNQRGSLLAAKIPYTNESEGTYNVVDYTFTKVNAANDTLSGKLYDSLINRSNAATIEEKYRIRDIINNKITEISNTVEQYPVTAINNYVDTVSAWRIDGCPISGVVQIDDTDTTVNTPSAIINIVNEHINENLVLSQNPATGLKRLITIDNNTTMPGVQTISEDALGIYRIGLIPESEPDFDGTADVIPQNSIRIVDIAHASLGVDAFGYERLGTFPVIVAAGNVLLNQSVIPQVIFDNIGISAEYIDKSSISFNEVFEPILQTRIIKGKIDDTYEYDSIGAVDPGQGINYGENVNLIDPDVELPLASADGSASLSLEVMNLFSSINTTDTGAIDTENTKYITVAVVEAYKDTLAANKINFRIREAFTGSPWIGTTDPTTGASVYLGDLINGNSNYIEFYTSLGRNVPNTTVADNITQEPNDIYFTNVAEKIAYETSFTSKMCEKNISEAQIIQSLQTIFNKCSNINAQDIDYIVDAGISNIAQYLAFRKKTWPKPTDKVAAADDPHAWYSKDAEDWIYVDKYEPTLQKWDLTSRDDTLSWRSIYSIYNTFCQNTRKDCMFLLDCLRPLTLEGSQKIVRPTKPSNNFDVNIYPKVTYIAGLNTSYGAGYSIWYYGQDDFTGDYIWLPPSIQAVGVNCFCDINANYWDAPAGLNRGILADALDISYNPGPVQSGMLYKKGWNFMVNWPADGITLEGQKTLQVKPSAFDRINVRKLFLRLERQTYKTCRYFVYEGNTAFTRQRVLDAISPMFNDAKIRGGLYDYKIVCDSSNNTPDVIDRNELIVDIALKPTRTAEFILLNFYALRTGASWAEAGM